jgi:hypothetical protein
MILNKQTEKVNPNKFNFGITVFAGIIFFVFFYANPIGLIILFVIFATLANLKFGQLSFEINQELDPITRSTALSIVNMLIALGRVFAFATLGVLAETDLFSFSLVNMMLLLILACVFLFPRRKLFGQKPI